MIPLCAIILGSMSRRIMGWGDASRLVGKVIGALAALIIMAPMGPWPAITCALLVPFIGFTLPQHGETQDKWFLMGMRNVAFTACLAALLVWLFRIDAWIYAPMGFLAGPAYGMAKAARHYLPTSGTYLDGWTAYGEHAIGLALIGGLATIPASRFVIFGY